MECTDDEYELMQCEEILVSEEIILPDDGDEDSDDTQHFDEDAPCHSNRNINEASSKINYKPIQRIDPLRDSSKLKYIRRPTRPVRLFSFSDRDLQKKFSQRDEKTKNLAVQLLNIVKSVNSQRKVKVENGAMVPNFYIMATKCESSEDQRITEMDSSGIVNLVKDIVHMIKIGIYRQVDYVDIICDSPAIFLIKHINVKHWDSSMNAVYVVTSEYLLPYLCKVRAAEEEEKKAEQRLICNAIPAEANRSTTNKRKKGSVTQTTKKVKLKSTVDEELPSNFLSVSSKTDEIIVEGLLSKYLEEDAVQFFISQMKIAGKTNNHYRWKDEDKLFALNLLRKAPTEYSILYQKYLLPSDKTLKKFVNKLQSNKATSSKMDSE